jgi:diamine N-acetyltransferase
MPSFSIKHANVDDIPVVIEIQKQTWEPTYGEILSPDQISFMFEKIYSPEALEQQMTVGKQKFMLLFNGEIAEGFASVSEETSNMYKLHKIYVLPSSQGTGAGKYLLTAVEGFLKSIGGTGLTLNVNRYNKARSFYEKMGFKVVREEDIPIGPYWMNDFVLEKPLI